jgi:hypothetical protein
MGLVQTAKRNVRFIAGFAHQAAQNSIDRRPSPKRVSENMVYPVLHVSATTLNANDVTGEHQCGTKEGPLTIAMDLHDWVPKEGSPTA